MNIQTFAYSTIINITKKIYEQKKILTFLKIYLLHIYMNIYIHREHIYIHIHRENAKKRSKKRTYKQIYTHTYTHTYTYKHINVQKKQGGIRGQCRP